MNKIGNRQVIGLTEPVTILSGDKRKHVQARIDSGATKSSIDLQLANELNLGPVVLSRVVRSASGTRTRPIIRATIMLKNEKITAYFTLAERSHMTYPVLIGQNILKKGRYLIDPLQP